ncbi:MAG: aminopeptidase P family N-terminal domain-containing protein, partial [Planctomycetota bacterium]
MADLQLDAAACRGRQKRLLEEMERLRVGLVVLTRGESIQWLTGARVGPLFTPTAAIDADGRVTLVLPSRKVETPAAADCVVPYEEKRLSTMCDLNEQRSASVAALLDQLTSTPSEAACE